MAGITANISRRLRPFRRNSRILISVVTILWLWTIFKYGPYIPSLTIQNEEQLQGRIGLPQFLQPPSNSVSTAQPRLPSESGQPEHVKQPSHVQKNTDLNTQSFWQRNVLYVWCGKETFTFENYLSVRSVIVHVRPSTITFLYKKFPVVDNATYNTWLDELQHNFPFWSNVPLDDNNALCHTLKHPSKTTMAQFSSLLHPQGTSGGLYIGPRTILTQSFHLAHPEAYIDAYNEETGEGLYYIPLRLAGQHRSSEEVVISNITCPLISHDARTIPDVCGVLNTEFYPENIMDDTSAMAAKIRFLVYGHPDFPKPAHDSTTLAPLMAHYVWLGGGEMLLGFYLSVLSALYVAEVDHVYIHADQILKGHYWNKILTNSRSDRITVLPWQMPHLVYNQSIHEVAHMADVIKSSVMYEYGGIMMDPDVLFLQKVPAEYRAYEAVVSPDITPYPPFPDILNMGISISKPRSRFAKLWLESERQFRDNEWLWNCGQVTYKLWERNPEIAYLSRHLQILCFQHKCHILWGDKNNYKNMDIRHNAMAGIKNWKTAAVSLHVTWPDPFLSLDNTVHVDSGMFGQTARMVLRAAGEIAMEHGKVP